MQSSVTSGEGSIGVVDRCIATVHTDSPTKGLPERPEDWSSRLVVAVRINLSSIRGDILLVFEN